ncbi:Wzz/FepE/Etk N-terminal domain-containing protein [uncultured Oceanisphaera sp.]|uniref:Wzz/FepE/Etk N-terminal domain-containing protein n=1 Tax=uncultured Oceanisphaera sp. TaxID=353858 RepID=UPI002625C9D7|nr:Wzz/FepE/Etk N-terminal domain-containing protein [uncultured Oceanisphaera sp.]
MSQRSLPQDAHFSQPVPSYSYRDDEISLVDIAKTLIKRRRLMALVFVLTVAAATLVAFMLSQKYEYTTIYTIAQADAEHPLESAAGLQTKVNSLYIPAVVREFLPRHQLEAVPFALSISNPRGSSLISITSQTTEDAEPLVQELHGAIAKRLKAEQNANIYRRTELLQQQIDAARAQIDLVKNAELAKAGELIASYTSTINDLQAQANSFQPGSISAIANQSLQPQGTSKKLVLALGLVLGAMLAVMAVFVREFISQLCASLQEE